MKIISAQSVAVVQSLKVLSKGKRNSWLSIWSFKQLNTFLKCIKTSSWKHCSRVLDFWYKRGELLQRGKAVKTRGINLFKSNWTIIYFLVHV